MSLRLIQIRLTTLTLKKVSPACQASSPQPRVADSNSKNALGLSFARTMNRFPLSRCASAIQIVRPLKSTAETQPQLQPAFLRLSAMISRPCDGSTPFDRSDWVNVAVKGL